MRMPRTWLVGLPYPAARLYDRLVRFGPIQETYGAIADDLVARIAGGRLLDVGTGPGWLLVEIARRNPAIELFGLDISKQMLRVAERNVAGTGARLVCADIARTELADGFFDLVTCTGSLYLFPEPRRSLDEIHRILKPGASACLYETHREFDPAELRRALRANLARAPRPLRWLAPLALRRQLSMTYSTEELGRLIRETRFRDRFAIRRLTLGRLPIWLRIELTAAPGEPSRPAAGATALAAPA